jgi:hypothetical protein
LVGPDMSATIASPPAGSACIFGFNSVICAEAVWTIGKMIVTNQPTSSLGILGVALAIGDLS